jgi:hypothetical protein
VSVFGLPDLDENPIDVAHTGRLVDDRIARLQALLAGCGLARGGVPLADM